MNKVSNTLMPAQHVNQRSYENLIWLTSLAIKRLSNVAVYVCLADTVMVRLTMQTLMKTIKIYINVLVELSPC